MSFFDDAKVLFFMDLLPCLSRKVCLKRTFYVEKRVRHIKMYMTFIYIREDDGTLAKYENNHLNIKI